MSGLVRRSFSEGGERRKICVALGLKELCAPLRFFASLRFPRPPRPAGRNKKKEKQKEKEYEKTSVLLRALPVTHRPPRPAGRSGSKKN